MIVTFEQEYLRELYEEGKCSDKTIAEVVSIIVIGTGTWAKNSVTLRYLSQ